MVFPTPTGGLSVPHCGARSVEGAALTAAIILSVARIRFDCNGRARPWGEPKGGRAVETISTLSGRERAILRAVAGAGRGRARARER